MDAYSIFNARSRYCAGLSYRIVRKESRYRVELSYRYRILLIFHIDTEPGEYSDREKQIVEIIEARARKSFEGKLDANAREWIRDLERPAREGALFSFSI